VIRKHYSRTKGSEKNVCPDELPGRYKHIVETRPNGLIIYQRFLGDKLVNIEILVRSIGDNYAEKEAF
jgi:hypothetical protein